ncbi:sensor histidine kinase [Microbacterium hominis]|uniref:histidine kinase n=1 Tax=Microbacterium hominis TaxID=162426 RepID=A0A7D4TMF0_9MICO|nr:ATP-binding protein [Microbacterium hominis]QKJ19022.1 HAMP domain-containing protein [Microbacterium hominis]
MTHPETGRDAAPGPDTAVEPEHAAPDPRGTEGGREPAATRTRAQRRPWTLQRRLIVTVVGIVSLILVFVAGATSVILGSVLESRLDQQVRATAERTSQWIGPYLRADLSAEEILEDRPVEPGFFLAVGTPASGVTAAVTSDDGAVVPLTDDQIDQMGAGVEDQDRGAATVTIDEVGTYSVEGFSFGPAAAVVGVSRADVVGTLSQMLITIALLTLGGLVLLGAATAWTIRAGLAPLRAVAETATRVSRQRLDQGEVSISERVPAAQADPRTEIGRVGEALNTLLDHVDASLDARQRNEERMRTFVADASHELRTPLASIRGYSELSLRALNSPNDAVSAEAVAETTGSALERIQAQSLRMTTLVEDLLLLARLDEGQELVFGSVDVSRLAMEAVADAQPAGPDHTWRLDLPEEPVIIAGDGSRVTQVLANLLANARTHTPAGTTVTVGVRHDDGAAVVSVHDDGPGVDPALRDELFERFARADRSRARKTGGTGLGLSIARAIVDAHGGTIGVESEPGDTTFTVRLPARPADPAPIGEALEGPQATAAKTAEAR